VQKKAEFIDAVMSRKALVKSLIFLDLNGGLAGNAAVARHIYASESETDGKPDSVKIGVLAVCQNATATGSCWLAGLQAGVKVDPSTKSERRADVPRRAGQKRMAGCAQLHPPYS